MANLYNIESEVEEIKKLVWNLSRKVIPALEQRIKVLEELNQEVSGMNLNNNEIK